MNLNTIKNYNRSDKSVPRAVRWTVELVIFAVIAVGCFFIFETMEADAAPATAPTSSSATENRACADSCAIAQKKVKQFKSGKIGNSKGAKLPKKFRKKLASWHANNKTTAKAQTGDWWNDPLGASWCWAGVVQTTACIAGRPDIAEDTTKMVVVCSGAGLIGSLKGGGWWGVFKGAAGCGWGMWASNNAF